MAKSISTTYPRFLAPRPTHLMVSRISDACSCILLMCGSYFITECFSARATNVLPRNHRPVLNGHGMRLGGGQNTCRVLAGSINLSTTLENHNKFFMMTNRNSLLHGWSDSVNSKVNTFCLGLLAFGLMLKLRIEL